MDFFQAQDTARRKTGRLVVLFALAVISLIVITNVLVLVTLGMASAETGGAPALADVEPAVFVAISLAVITVVGFGSLYKTATLRGGGARVAESLGARLLVPGSGDIDEQRVLNVVEEMAIASSTPVPPVYLMEEDAINAFAAGFSPSDAVIGVTRGAIGKLSREELQGVIAHEFSHILHGDMRLNIRLIGLLHGILVLGMMGYYLMRSAAISRRGKNGNGLVFLGLGLIVIGAAGTFFGNLIKAAVSRQREYLADASAVQFTRSADGIAGALKRIGGDASGSQLSNPGAREISHALFSQGVSTSFSALFATHPPLPQRIQRLQPQWDGEFSQPTSSPDTSAEARGETDERQSNTAPDARQRSATVLEVAAVAALQRSGAPDSADLQQAICVRDRLPAAFINAAHEPHGARALIYFLLLDTTTAGDLSLAAGKPDDNQLDAARTAQCKYLEANADSGVYPELSRLVADSSRLSAGDRLALVNISLSALHQLSPAQYTMFERNMRAILDRSADIAPMSWLYHYLVLKHLRPVFDHPARSTRGRRLKQCKQACTVTLSVMAHLGQAEAAAADAFDSAADRLYAQLPGLAKPAIMPRAELDRVALTSAFDALQGLAASDKQAFLLAAAACMQSDGQVTAAEQELFQTFAEILDCPTPALF